MPEHPSNTKLIVGLGNPGGRYELTRHNLGFRVVTHLAEAWNVKFRASSFINGSTAHHEEDGVSVILLMPATYMNRSGVAVNRHPIIMILSLVTSWLFVTI